MIALPAPQKSTIPMVLSARFVAPLGVGSVFDFSLLPPVDLVNVNSGFLYRILGYSFATELPEATYAAALITGFPLSYNLFNTGNQSAILAKPVPLPMYQRDARFLQYWTVTEDTTTIQARLSGRLDGNTPDLIGYASVTAVLSLFVQCLSDDDWTTKYDRGEM